MKEFRTEKDSLGQIQIPYEAYWGIHTFRSISNFVKSGEKISLYLIKSLLQIKKAAAYTNGLTGELPAAKAEVIEQATDQLLKETEDAIEGKNCGIYQKIIVDPYQGGAGTSLNMNINEVIANTALEILNKKKGEYNYIHPLDDVNMSQSTNDVFPTAVKMASIYLLRKLTEEFAALQGAFQEKEKEFSGIIKVGRTQMQDAVPITLGQEFGAYAQAVSRDRWRLYKVKERLRSVNLGGTAIGTGITASRKYILQIVNNLRQITGLNIAKGEDLIDQTQNADVFVEVHGLIKAGASTLIKIANDIRLLSSGPQAGLGEITLPPVQHGSSIMPGKINPVIPENLIQISQMVMGHDMLIGQLAASGSLELNPFLPMLSHLLLKSFSLLANAIFLFREKAIVNLLANPEKCKESLLNSYSIGTFLINLIGYDEATTLIKEAQKNNKTIVEMVAEKGIMSEKEFKHRLSTALGVTGKTDSKL